MDYVAPQFELDAFNCPHCRAYSQMDWSTLFRAKQAQRTPVPYMIAVCTRCGKNNVWLRKVIQRQPEIITSGRMVYPDVVTTPPAIADMPDDVKAEYNEAATVLNKSPRSAAALLRQALQKLMVHLGEPGKKIDADIRSLAKKEKLPAMLIKVADTMRLTGNDSVHPGEMLDEDRDHIATKMFDLLNHIVYSAITQPKEFEAMYNMTPEHKRKAAEEKDAKAKLIAKQGS